MFSASRLAALCRGDDGGVRLQAVAAVRSAHLANIEEIRGHVRGFELKWDDPEPRLQARDDSALLRRLILVSYRCAVRGAAELCLRCTRCVSRMSALEAEVDRADPRMAAVVACSCGRDSPPLVLSTSFRENEPKEGRTGQRPFGATMTAPSHARAWLRTRLLAGEQP